MSLHVVCRMVFAAAVHLFTLLLPGCTTAPRVVRFAEDIRVSCSGSDAPLQYRMAERVSPRPLRIHIVTLDTANPAYAVTAHITADPDGDGSAEAVLQAPAVCGSL